MTTLIHNAGVLLTLERGHGDGPLGLVRDGAVVIDGDRVRWAGAASDLDASTRESCDHAIDAEGRLVSPGLVDPHTHVVWAGNRAGEFAMRAAGKSYAEIAAAGGGILSTVRAVRAASLDQLVDSARPRLQRMLERGVTTVEAKSGYGLTVDDELKLLRVVRALNQDPQQRVELIPTLLGAHAVPPEYRDQTNGADAYVDIVVEEMIPQAAEEELAVFCDVFVERGFYTVEQGRRVIEAARQAGLRPKLHVDQLHAGGGAELAAEVDAVSADHLDHASDAGLKQLADAGTVAVLLPGAAIYLGDEPPDARRFIDAGLDVALASDCNPGTCPTDDIALMMTMACSLCGMTVEEAWLAVTRNAARAVGRDDLGHLGAGARADVVIWDCEEPAGVPYEFGYPRASRVIQAGSMVERA